MPDKVKLNSVVQGCMTWGKWGANFSKEGYQKQIEACLNHGVTTFDHADIYGGYSTEAEFGAALADMKLNRENIQLISKCGIQMENFRNNTVKHYQYDTEYILASVEQSLQHLKTDYLDVFLLHRPSPLMQLTEIEKAIKHLLQQGKIKRFGVSNFEINQIELLQTKLSVDYNQIQISLTHSTSLENGMLEYLQKQNIQVLAWNPLGNYFQKATSKLQNQVKMLAEKYNANEDQILLSWLNKHPSKIVSVIGTTQANRVQSAQEALQIELTLQDWFLLWETARDKQVA